MDTHVKEWHVRTTVHVQYAYMYMCVLSEVVTEVLQKDTW